MEDLVKMKAEFENDKQAYRQYRKVAGPSSAWRTRLEIAERKIKDKEAELKRGY
jgi:hypothetical protein